MSNLTRSAANQEVVKRDDIVFYKKSTTKGNNLSQD